MPHMWNRLKSLCLAAACATIWMGCQTSTPFIKGADVSSLTHVEKRFTFKDENGQTRPGGVLELLKENGFNAVRIHLWHTPENAGHAYGDLEYVQELAKRAKDMGFLFMLDIMYSDDWANPAKQFKPADWKDLSHNELKQAVYDYSAEVVRTLAEAGACPDIIQCGNEIAGKILETGASWEPQSGYYELIEQGILGCKSAIPEGHHVRFLHHVNGTHAKNFYGNAQKSVIWEHIDILGMSYYLFYNHGTLAELPVNLAELSELYDRDVMIVETAFPARPIQPRQPAESHVEEWEPYGGMTPEGQEAWVRFLLKTLREVPNDRGIGLCWFSPMHGLDNLMFDDEKKALPALKAFRE